MAHQKNDEIKSWMKNVIGEARKIVADPNLEFMHDYHVDVSSPLQVDVFWTEDPELYLVIFFNDKSSSDLEINVHDPIDPKNTSNLVEILSNKKFLQKSKDEDTLGERIGNIWFDGLKDYFEISIDESQKKFYNEYSWTFSSVSFNDNVQITKYFGDMIHSDFEKIKKRFQSMLKPKKTLAEDRKNTRIDSDMKYYGTHIFPPVNIGEIKKPKLEQILKGQQVGPRKVFSDEYDSVLYIVESDGLIACTIKSKSDAISNFNTLMGIFIIKDKKFRSVRVNDLYQININEEEKIISGMGYRTDVTLRGQLLINRHKKDEHHIERSNLTSDEIKQVLEINSKIKLPYVIEDLVYLSESFTALDDSTFPQSFVLSWLIIERFLYRKWNDWWKTKIIPNEKILSLQADRLLQFLKSIGEISEMEYGMYNLLRDIRNNFIHAGKTIEEDAAKKCFEIAKTIVKNELP